jgi:DNA-directed RNA polymerase specialized sigma subunit
MMMENVEKMIEMYKPSTDIFDETADDEMNIYKEAVQILPPADKIIFLLYTEKQSLRAVAKVLGVSHTIVAKEIKKIRQKIKEYVIQTYPNKNLRIYDI